LRRCGFCTRVTFNQGIPGCLLLKIGLWAELSPLSDSSAEVNAIFFVAIWDLFRC
jgi:hypothetical protein